MVGQTRCFLICLAIRYERIEYGDSLAILVRVKVHARYVNDSVQVQGYDSFTPVRDVHSSVGAIKSLSTSLLKSEITDHSRC